MSSSTAFATSDEHDEREAGSGVHSKPLVPGDRIDGKYVMRRTLGAGGWAVVYEAEHVVMKHHVAIKVLRPDEDSQALALERFRREARLSASIRHPNVLEVFDVGNLSDGSPYLVMELLRGEDLDSRLAGGPLHVAEVLDVGEQLMGALSALAAQGVVHRDIKPHNLFLHEEDDGDLVLKLLDFGIARQDAMCAPASRLTTKGELLGTPHYMAPEQLRNESIDCRTDLYAACVVLYELLTGVTPHDEPTQGALIASVLRDPAPNVMERRPDCPEELAALITRGLSKDIEARWSSPEEMGRELARIRCGLGYPSGADAWSPAARTVTSAQSTETGARLSHLPTLAARADGAAETQRGPETPRVAWGRRIFLTATAAVALALPLGAWSASHAGADTSAEKKAVAVKVKAAAETVAVRAAEEPADRATPPEQATRPIERDHGDARPATVERRGRVDPPRVVSAPPAASSERLRREALAAYVRGQLARARRLFRRAVAANRDDAQAWRGLGIVTSTMGERDEARAAFRRYLHLQPNAADASEVRTRLAAL